MAVFDVDRGGAWRRASVDGVSRKHGSMGADFVHFLDLHQEQGGNIYWNARDFMLKKKYTEEQAKFFKNLLDMYIHKVLRKLPKDED